MIALYIILGISLIALVYLFIVVVRGGNKNSASFQRELALRNAKKNSKELAKEYVEGNITFEELSEKIYNKETLKRVQTNEEKTIQLTKEKDELHALMQEKGKAFDKSREDLKKAKESLKEAKANNNDKLIEKYTKLCSELQAKVKEQYTELAKDLKTFKSLESAIKQLKYDLKVIISNYSYGAQTGTAPVKLTRSEKHEEKRIIKENMKVKKEQWKQEDQEYYAAVKANIAKLKEEVKESTKVLKELEKAYKEEKKKNLLAEKALDAEAKEALNLAKAAKKELLAQTALTEKLVKMEAPEAEINAQKSVDDIANTNTSNKRTRKRSLQQVMQESFFYGANRFGNNFIA